MENSAERQVWASRFKSFGTEWMSSHLPGSPGHSLQLKEGLHSLELSSSKGLEVGAETLRHYNKHQVPV